MKKYFFKKNHVKNANTGELEPCIMILEADSYQSAAKRQHTQVGFMDCDNSEISVYDLCKMDGAESLFDHGVEYRLI